MTISKLARRLLGFGTHSLGALVRAPIAAAVSLIIAIACALTPTAASAQEAAEAAAVLAGRASALYEEGDFARAASLYREALALHDDANLHYNLARALQDLGEWSEAREHYVVYLGMTGDDPDRGRVEARVRVLDELLAQAAPPAVPDPAPEPEPPVRPLPVLPPARSADPAPWIVVGLGAATLVGASLCAWQFQEAVDAARAAPNHASALPHAERADQLAIAADALFVVGGVAALVGLIWGIVDLTSSGAPASADETVSFDGRSLRVRF